VMTWSGKGQRNYDVAHIDILGEKALLYKDRRELLNFLLTLDPKETARHDWDVYTKRFSAENVIRQYTEVFLGWGKDFPTVPGGQ